MAVADCQSADCRVVEHVPVQVQDLSHASVRLIVPPGEFASSMTLSGHIVLADDSSPHRDLRAHKEAARIHSSKQYTVALEGDGGRFPTEAISFSSLGYGNAPWMIDAKFSDLTDSFVATVRLFLNTDNAVAKQLLNGTRSADLAPILRAEILRVLLATVSYGRFDIVVEEVDDESVGAVLDGMCKMFLNRDLGSAIRLLEQDPSRFELVLHSKIEPLDYLMR
ncbi:hypothetical protein [Gordonia alkanivorans]|uniref:hypothetical protein n=1 Tax=Gordonia alkanivorans TaxID=84096 RepID=UPI0012DC97EE|nr:hypothetical protein [Gordonia alkanivorans]